MSAWIVSKAHIDYMVTAGLRLPRPHGPLRWFDADPFDEPDNWEAGEPWGPNSLVWFTAHRRELTPDTAGQVGAMLWAENRRSVNHRYAEEEIEEPYLFAEVRDINPVWTLNAIRCYTYQTCEHPEWEKSEAFRFIQSLKDAAIAALEGINEAPWGIDTDDVQYVRPVRR